MTDNIVIGLFLRFTGTDRNIIFFDTKTNQTRSARHVEYDETHYHDNNTPPYAKRLQNLVQTELLNKEIDDSLPKHISSKDTLPTSDSQPEQPALVSDDEDSVVHCVTSPNGFNSTDAINLNAETASVHHMETDDLLLIDTPYDGAVKIKLKN